MLEINIPMPHCPFFLRQRTAICHAAQLPSLTVALRSKLALGRERSLLAAGQTTHISIQHLLALLIVVPIALAVLAVDLSKRLLHLLHILGGEGIQSLLDDRLFGAGGASKRLVQRVIVAQASIDFHRSMRVPPAGQSTRHTAW